MLSLSIEWNFLLDGLSVTMLLVVFTISMFVHIYSYYYMFNDLNSSKFMAYLTLFTFFMCILVISSNFIILFLGWEGVGLCSFLLISFWNTRLQANKSAIKAMLINRIGDYFILIAIIIILLNFKSLDFYVVFSQAHFFSLKNFLIVFGYNITVIDAICFFLLIGAVTKSAQIGLHGWLPDAMEGPTPVSALIHAATMVTAGVFLIIRCSYLFEFSLICLDLLVYLGSFTLVLFGLVGLAQYDIKKIIAYSTCSQLGYMILGCGLSGYSFALYHLFTHAAFKALLFLSAGTIIHTMNNEQDLRKLNGLFNVAPLVSICFIIGSLSLSGFPYLSGYYSKDAIIELSYYFYKNPVVFLFALSGVFITLLYSLKIVYYLFFKTNYNNKFNLNILKNYSFNLFNFVPLIILALLSIFCGYLFKNFFLGLGNNIFYGSIFVLRPEILQVEFLWFGIKFLPFFILLFSFLVFDELFFGYFKENPQTYAINHDVFLFFNKRMFLDSLLNLFINFFIYKLSYKIFYIFDKGLLEFFGPFGISCLLNFFFELFSKKIHSGYLSFYVIYIFSILIILILLMLFFIF